MAGAQLGRGGDAVVAELAVVVFEAAVPSSPRGGGGRARGRGAQLAAVVVAVAGVRAMVADLVVAAERLAMLGPAPMPGSR